MVIELLLALLVIPLAGYALGRTIGEEDIFADMRNRVAEGPYLKHIDKDGNSHYIYPEEGGSEAVRSGNSWFYVDRAEMDAYRVPVIEPTPEPEDWDEDIDGEWLDDGVYQICLKNPNFYQPGVWGFIKGKVGDLLQCIVCLAAQTCLWSTIAWLLFGFVVLEILSPLAVIGVGYLVISRLHNG